MSAARQEKSDTTNEGAVRAGDMVFFTVKDLSHGIIGMAADGTMAGPLYDPGFEPK